MFCQSLSKSKERVPAGDTASRPRIIPKRWECVIDVKKREKKRLPGPGSKGMRQLSRLEARYTRLTIPDALMVLGFRTSKFLKKYLTMVEVGTGTTLIIKKVLSEITQVFLCAYAQVSASFGMSFSSSVVVVLSLC